ncbi:glycosyltransferase family protein [Halobacillus sp. A1]|uniref:cytidylyltransferase domain-containing protein n=1 Tax=Halobacillus sp. A1 TaxID=2880262 RepID=UPI0020A6565E|nr:glycosyltransferase family protein [Halobacillus sp. A1]
MKVAAIIQARMGSTRLPGKVLKKVLQKPLLEYQIERLKRCKLIDQIIIATSSKVGDDPIERLAQQLSVECYRGSEEDVLARYYEAAVRFNSDVIVRMTSDCPLIDPHVVDRVTDVYLNGSWSYVSNTLIRSYPRGMDTEVFSISTLQISHQEAKEKSDREHVTSYMIKDARFTCENVSYQKDQSRHRWTVDTEEDFQLVRRIIEKLYPLNPHFTLEDSLALLQRHPEWCLLNRHIEQKKT